MGEWPTLVTKFCACFAIRRASAEFHFTASKNQEHKIISQFLSQPSFILLDVFSLFHRLFKNDKKKFKKCLSITRNQTWDHSGASLAFLSGLARNWVWCKRCEIPNQHLKHTLALFKVHLLRIYHKHSAHAFKKHYLWETLEIAKQKHSGSAIITSKTILIADLVTSYTIVYFLAHKKQSVVFSHNTKAILFPTCKSF